MLERIRESLLDDPVRRQLDAERKLARVTVDAELDRKAGLAQLLDERRHIAEPWLGCERLAHVVAEHAEQAAHLGQCTAPGVLDGLEHLARRGIRVPEHAPLRTRLHDHHRDVVGDHIVQLACDPRPFLDNGLTGGHVALALGDLHTAFAVADDTADKQHHHDRDHDDRNGVVQVALWSGTRREVDCHDRHQAERKATWRRPDRQRVQRAAVGDGIADDLRVSPDAKFDRDEHSRGDTGSRGI